MHGLRIPKPTGQEGDFFLIDGTPYFGPTHIGSAQNRFSGTMPSPEAQRVFTREEIMAIQFQNLLIRMRNDIDNSAIQRPRFAQAPSNDVFNSGSPNAGSFGQGSG